ncbi:MAG: hypothetical protein AABO58_05480 [Acidobacteriota bacterium]
MARYIQRIALLGKERWIGWEIDGVGTELSGLTLADHFSEEELRAKGIKEFTPLSFETFLGMNADSGGAKHLLDQDIDFRLDALQVGMERIRGAGGREVPRAFLTHLFGGDGQLNHPRVIARLAAWEDAGKVEFVGREECYLRIKSPLG